MSLTTYQKKRDFRKTAEPKGKKALRSRFRFVVQRHAASHLHYDFRLELGGVLKSWAVPKGPSLNPAQKRLAVMVEDHPVSYIGFKGTIPRGNYGAGKVEIWDKGSFTPVDGRQNEITEKQALAALKKGELKFRMKGKKLKGEFVLVRLKNDDKNWLLIKHKDEYAVNTIYDAENAGHENKAPVSSIRRGSAKKIKGFIKPMLATLTKQPFDDPDWIFEIKWDGYRAVADLSGKKPLLYSRNGVDFSGRFPSVFQALEKIPGKAVLDGEIVLLNEHDRPDFQKLQHYENHLNYPLVYYVFDLLELNGKSTEELPLTERKKLLKKILANNQVVRYCDHIEGDGVAFLKQARAHGLEGIMAKKRDSTYSEGYRSREWLKIKNIQTTEVVIAGYTRPKGTRAHFGSLILANKKGKKWIYRGHVGTGFSRETLASLKKIMHPLERKESPFTSEVPVNDEVTWLKPELVADIAYSELTRDNIFRHPVFLHLRDDKNSGEVNEEAVDDMTAVKRTEEQTVGRYKVSISNRHKIFWPEEGYTKGDVIDFYDQISSFILPYLKDRPLSLKRNPNGIRDAGFFHKDAGEHAPKYVDVFQSKTGDNKIVDYVVCNNKASLLYLANLGCIEINPWNSRTARIDYPTWMVIDIDPSAKNSFQEVVDTALAVKQVLDKAGIKGFCKTSGASGLHVYTPLKNRYDYQTVKDFAHIIARHVQEMLPGITTLERSLAKRGPKIYIDYLQNRVGQTLATAYSLRPVPGAQVSAPLEWKEVNHRLSPSLFTIRNMKERLQKKGDLFKPVLTGTSNLEKALKKLDQ